MLIFVKMDDRTLRALEFTKILERISKYASSSLGKSAILKLTPNLDFNQINISLNEIEQAFIVSEKCSKGISFSFDDITDIFNKAKVFSTLNNNELLKVSRFIKIAINVKQDINSVKSNDIFLLKDYVKDIILPIELSKYIDENIISETEISDNASSVLKNIRKKIKTISEQIKRKLDSYVNSRESAKFLQDSIVTIRNDRYVIPVKAEYKNSINGLIHDQSSSGQTLFIEPFTIVEMNNELKSVILLENQEIEKILRDLTTKVSAIVDNLNYATKSLTSLDAIFAKSYYAYSTDSVKPTMNSKGLIEVELGRHPLIEKDSVVPTTINIGKTFRVLLITGPNTGGKTVVLKLVGIMELMALSGLFVPAKKAELSTFDNIFCDIGDEQSIEQSLSTFSGHIKNIKYITDNMSSNSLILLDELGAGTDPTEGAGLAVSILDYILKNGARAILTTHFNELKEYAFVTDNVENASMDFNPKNYQPTYKIIIGTPGQSNAIEIASKIGLNSSIVKKAKLHINKESNPNIEMINALENSLRNARNNEDTVNRLLLDIDEKNKILEKEIEKVKIKRQKLEQKGDEEANKIIREALVEANQLIENIKLLTNSPTDSDLFKAREIKRNIQNLERSVVSKFDCEYPELEKQELYIGCDVKIIPLNVTGKVYSINENRNSIEVLTGNIKSIFKKDQLIPIYIPPKSEKVKRENISSVFNTNTFSSELKIVGLTVQEAIPEIEKFLNSAYNTSVNHVKIIHGIGTGRLREGVRMHLKNHVLVKYFQDGDYLDGGKGVTLITLNK